MRSDRPRLFEQLENRLYLSVTATVIDGNLVVEGEAAGAVEVTAQGGGAFEVKEGDSTPIQVTGVTGGIRITLDQGGAANDVVTLDLGGEAVDRVMVDLGDGSNEFTLQNGTVSRRLQYVGGEGDDVLAIAQDAIVEGLTYARLGDGDNTLALDGQIARSLAVKSGDGSDTVTLTGTARVEGALTAALGDGENSLEIQGGIGGSLSYFGGNDGDQVLLGKASLVGRSVSICLGDGDNTVTLDGTVERDAVIRGRDGNDAVTINETATIGRSAKILLGDGDNSFTQTGSIERNLSVRSLNQADEERITTTDDKVGGQVDVQLGETTTWPWHHGWGHGFRSLALGRGGFGRGMR